MDVIVVALSALILIISAYLLYAKRNLNSPPCIRGWIPWFGAAFEFGKAPLDFIAQARLKHGPVFTVFAAGKRLTFVTLHEDFRTFFMSKDVDFEQAVQEPVHHTASISKESFYKFHPACNSLIKGRLTQANLPLLSSLLCEEFNFHLELLGCKGSAGLNDLVRSVMYPAVMSNLLGKCNSPNCPTTVQEFKEKFRIYDEGFEYGSQLPDIFLRDWAKSKHWLLSLLGNMVIKAEGSKPTEGGTKTLLQHLVTTITDKFLPNYGLLMLWASLANAIPMTFWALAFILSNPSVHRTAVEQITTVLKSQVDLYTRAAQILCGIVGLSSMSHMLSPDALRHFRDAQGWYALMEIHMFVSLILYKFEFTLLDPMPKPSSLHLVGTQQPDGPCRVQYRHR